MYILNYCHFRDPAEMCPVENILSVYLCYIIILLYYTMTRHAHSYDVSCSDDPTTRRHTLHDVSRTTLYEALNAFAGFRYVHAILL